MWHNATFVTHQFGRFWRAGSTGHCNTARSLSAGVSNLKVFRGRWLSRRAILFRLAWEKCERSVPRGKYCRSRPLVERCDVRVIRSTEKVSFPVAGHSAVIDLGRPFADGHRIDDLSQSALRRATLGLAHLPRRAQVCHQLLFQHTACLNKETAIDRLVRYLHALIGRELPLQPA